MAYIINLFNEKINFAVLVFVKECACKSSLIKFDKLPEYLCESNVL